MGRRQRKREKGSGAPAATTDYTDGDGNVLTLRDELSPGTVTKIRELQGPAAASAEDIWQRREELLFERLAVRWTIASLPLEDQATLLGRYRMASGDERAWVREAISRHVDRHLPGLKD